MRAVVSLLLVLAVAGPAVADDGVASTLAPTVLTVPTAWTQPGTAIYASGDADHRGAASARATLSFQPAVVCRTPVTARPTPAHTAQVVISSSPPTSTSTSRA